MARKDLFLINGTFFYDDSRSTKPKNGLLLRKWLIKAMRSMGVPLVDPCCENEDNLYPLVWNAATGQDGYILNGTFIAVETATGATAPGGTTSTTTSTTSTTSTTTTLP